MQVSQDIKIRFWNKVEGSLDGLSTLSIKGVVKKKGVVVTNPCLVFLFDRNNMNAIARTFSGPDGTYQFSGLVTGFKYAVAAKDPMNQYNAVIQDNVVPK
mgnify:FL=1